MFRWDFRDWTCKIWVYPAIFYVSFSWLKGLLEMGYSANYGCSSKEKLIKLNLGVPKVQTTPRFSQALPSPPGHSFRKLWRKWHATLNALKAATPCFAAFRSDFARSWWVGVQCGSLRAKHMGVPQISTDIRLFNYRNSSQNGYDQILWG